MIQNYYIVFSYIYTLIDKIGVAAILSGFMKN